MLVLPKNLSSVNPKLIERTADLNAVGESTLLAIISRQPHDGDPKKGQPLVHYLDDGDIHPAITPAPAWYIPASNDIYIHCGLAGLGVPASINLYEATHHADRIGKKKAIALGLLSHEAAHASISDYMDDVVREHPEHLDLITTLEELRVEAHAVKRTPQCRRFLRASMALIIANLPDEYENKGHVVRAWTLVHGRTLAGVSDPDETASIDTAARTMLDDDIVDALADLVQEALSLNTNSPRGRKRLIEICDEWNELVPPPPALTVCTHVARVAVKGEKTDNKGGGGKTDEKAAGSDDDGSGGGGGEPGDDDAGAEGGGGGEPGGADPGDAGEGGEAGDIPVGEHNWGDPGTEQPDEDSADQALSDEDRELMRMVARDAERLMQKGWDKAEVGKRSNSAEWAAKIFGNTKASARIHEREPTPVERQHVVKVSAALASVTLPAITKTAKPMIVPPGRLRSREAVRAAAERAQGQMVSARPWRGTVRRHSASRPLIVGVATDTSGSMSWAERGVATFAYVYSNAGHRIGARTAAVTFGDYVHRIARPGEVMANVRVKSASDGTERFDEAMAALDGVLHLTEPSYAAKLLFVICDSALVGDGQPEACTAWMKAMDKAGTHIIWITDSHGGTPFFLDLVKTLPHLVHRKAGVRRYGDEGRVFDFLNAQALDAIAKDLHQ